MIRSIPYSLRFLKNVMQSAQMQKCMLNNFIIRYSRSNSCHHHNVQTCRQSFFVQPERLPYQPSHPMSYYTVSYLFTDGDTNPPFCIILPFYIHYQLFISKRFSSTICRLKILPALNAWKSFHTESAFCLTECSFSTFFNCLQHLLLQA